MDDRCFDYIVIGAGINGTWSAYHLSKRGYKVLLIDQVGKNITMSLIVFEYLAFLIVKIGNYAKKC